MKDILDDKLTQELGDKLRGFREEPPAGMFDRIEQTLLASGVVEPTPAKEPAVKVVPLWRRTWVRGVAATLAAASLALAVMVGLRENMPEEIVVAQMPEVEAPTPELAGEEVADLPEVEMLAMQMAPKVAPIVVAAVQLEDMMPEVEQVSTAEESNEVAVQSEQNTTERRAKKSKTPRTTRQRSSSRKSDAELDEYWRGIFTEEPRQRSLANLTQVALYASNLGFDQGHIQSKDVVNSPMLLTENNQLTSGSSYLSPMLVQPKAKSRLEHFMPVTVGVTVSYALNDWLSIDSGLLYTNLYSTSDTSGAVSDFARKRTIDYLGVPLAMSIYFADFDRLSLYGKLGGTAELCISAKDKEFMDGVMTRKTKLDVAPLTFSLDAAVGAGYALWGGLGLFGEVGCSYWLAPDNYPENYRTVHPLSLSIRAGLRFTFN